MSHEHEWWYLWGIPIRLKCDTCGEIMDPDHPDFPRAWIVVTYGE